MPKKPRKPSDSATEKLNPRQAKYVEAIVDGKSKKAAAISAGYSESSAENAASVIEGTDVRAAFREIMQRACSPEKLAQRIAEGLDAIETRFFAKDGEVIESRDVIAWSERRQYAELVAKYGGFFVERQELGVHLESDEFKGWTKEEKQRFAATGDQPERLKQK